MLHWRDLEQSTRKLNEKKWIDKYISDHVYETEFRCLLEMIMCDEMWIPRNCLVYSSRIPSFISFLYKLVAKQIWIHASCKLNPLIRVYMVLPTLCACKYSYVHENIHMYMYTYISIHIHYVHVHVHVHHVHVNIHMYMYMCISIHVHVFIHTCTLCTCTCVYPYMYTMYM